MTLTEFRRLCDGRTRVVRVGGTQSYVRITRAEAEKLHAALRGAVAVDTTGEGLYAFIAPYGVAGADPERPATRSSAHQETSA